MASNANAVNVSHESSTPCIEPAIRDSTFAGKWLDHDLRPEGRRTYIGEFRTAVGESIAISGRPSAARRLFDY
jgi:hypothetical protein